MRPRLARLPEPDRVGVPGAAGDPGWKRRARLSSAGRLAVLYIPTLLVVVTLVFAIPRAMPGDPLAAREDPENALYVADPLARERLLDYYGLDEALPVQYGQYLARLATGDLGWSIARNIPVAALIGQHLPWTLLLVGTSLALASILSYVAGIAAAWRRELGATGSSWWR